MSTDRDKSEGQNEQDFAATGRESEGLHIHLCELFLEIKPCPQVGRLRCRNRKVEIITEMETLHFPDQKRMHGVCIFYTSQGFKHHFY